MCRPLRTEYVVVCARSALFAVACLLSTSMALANVRYVGDVSPQGDDTGGGVGGATLAIGDADLGGIFIDPAPSLFDPNALSFTLESGRGILGGTVDGVGRVELTDGRWDVTSGGSLATPALIVGDEGLGLLDLFTSALVHVGTAGSNVGTGVTVVGDEPTGQGQVTINTIASRLRTGELVVGNEGLGTVDINFNGSMVSTDSTLGALPGGMGTVTLNDTSRWDMRGILTIGTPSTPGSAVIGTGVVNLNGNSLLQASVGTSVLTVNPSGTVNFDGGTFRNTRTTVAISNSGVMRGDGTIDSDLDIEAGGELRNAADLANLRERILVTGAVTVAGNEDVSLDPNDGLIESIGGEMEFLNLVENDGFIVARDAIMRFRGSEVSGSAVDLDLDGAFVIGGETTIYGTISTSIGPPAPPAFGNSGGNFIVLSDTIAELFGDVIFGTAPLVAAISEGPVAASTAPATSGGFTFTVGENPGSLTILGELVLDGNAVLELDYSSSVASQPGDSFQLLSAQSITGDFANTLAVADGRFWDVDVVGDEVMVTATNQLVDSADFNGDGSIDGLDFLTWQQGVPALYDGDDLDLWEAGYGEGQLAALGGGGGGVATATAVPEPGSVVLALSTLGLLATRRRS